MKFKAICKCYDGKKVWEEGEVGEFEKAPNKHFQPVSDNTVSIKPVERDIMAAIPHEPGKFVKPDGGMGAKLEIDVPKPMETAGQVNQFETLPPSEKIDRRTKEWRNRNA